MTPSAHRILEFGPFRLDPAERVLVRDGRPVPLTLKAFDVLLLLVQNNGHIVEKGELMNRVWAGSFVEEGNLKVTVSMVRKALGDTQGDERYIETVARRGYRFVTEVREITESIDVVLRERTRESLTIDEISFGSRRRLSRGLQPWVIAVVLIVFGFVGGFFLFRNRTKSLETSAQAAPIKSIAVLPFRPLIASNRDELLEIGIAETLIMRLNRIGSLKVPPTGAIRKYNRLDQDPLAAGRELQVESVLDGSLQREGDRLRVTVRLMRVADGETLWTEKFDEKVTEIFGLEDRLSERLVSALSVRLTAEQRQVLVKHYTENTEAYRLYLQGNYSTRTEDRFNKSLEYYNEAIRLDPSYALPYAGLADTYMRLGQLNYLPANESYPKTLTAASKALELDERLLIAHIIMGDCKLNYEWNPSEAERHFKRAIELDPEDSWAHSAYGSYLQKVGRFDEAINEKKRTRELAPTNAAEISNLGWTYYYAGKYPEAIAVYKQAMELNPRFPWAHVGLGRTYLSKGQHEEAIAELNNAISLSEGNVRAIGMLGYAYAVTGKHAEARRLIADLEILSRQKYVPAYFIAIIHAGLGDRDQTFAWLERAFSERYPSMTLLKTETVFDSVRSDPRFANLMRRVGIWV